MTIPSRLRQFFLRKHAPSCFSATATPISSIPAEPRSKTWDTAVTHMPTWPQHARHLKKHTWISYLYLVGDVILVLLPIYFILLSVAVVLLNGRPTKGNAFGTKVEFAIDLGPTLFPIMFAAICGRSMKMIARYIAESGAKLSTLELLMASQSVWGAVESQLLMQRVTMVGANLLFLWALSPLGGQASLRLMQRGDHETYSSSKLRYMSTGPAATMLGMITTYETNGKFADASALYTAALMAPQASKIGSQDPWGNVKIPSLEAYNVTDSSQWFDLPSGISSPEIYSSLVGLPIVGLPSNASSSFTLETNYFTVECGSFEQSLWPSLVGSQSAYTNWTKLEEMVPGRIWNPPSADNDPFYPLNVNTSFFIDTDRPMYPSDEIYHTRLGAFLGNANTSSLQNGNETVREPRGLLYASKYPAGDGDTGDYMLNVARCSISQNHLEAMISCKGNSCATDRIRKSQSDTRSNAYTGLEHSLMMYGLVQHFPLAAGVSTDVGASSATERFLANSSSYPFLQKNGHPSDKEAFVDLSLVPTGDFSKRLGLLLNTYYQLSIQPIGYFGSLSNNLSFYGPDTLPVNDIDAYLPANMSATNHTIEEWYTAFDNLMQDSTAPFIGATTMANVTFVEQVYICSFPWLALLLTCSTIVFIIGAAALVLKRRTLGPELFGFVSSMTYENPYIKIPGGGTTLDAMERARLMKDVEVYVADVAGDEDVGHVAFAAGVSLRKLERGRIYA